MVREHDRGSVESCDRYIEQLVDMTRTYHYFFWRFLFLAIPFTKRKKPNDNNNPGNRQTAHRHGVFFFGGGGEVGFWGPKFHYFPTKKLGNFGFLNANSALKFCLTSKIFSSWKWREKKALMGHEFLSGTLLVYNHVTLWPCHLH